MRFITKTSLNPRSSIERPHVYFGDFTAGRKFEVSRQCHGIRTRTPLLKFIIQRSRFKLSLVTESKHDKNNGMTEKPPLRRSKTNDNDSVLRFSAIGDI